MELNEMAPWYQRPGPALAVGVALLGVCAIFATLWFTSDFLLARPLGM